MDRRDRPDEAEGRGSVAAPSRQEQHGASVEIRRRPTSHLPLWSLALGCVSFGTALLGWAMSAIVFGILAAALGAWSARFGAGARLAMGLVALVLGIIGALMGAGLLDRDRRPAPAPASIRGLYEGVRPGMSVEEVNGAFGGPGEEISWRRMRGEEFMTQAWASPSGYTILVTFHDGRVIRKAQLGVY